MKFGFWKKAGCAFLAASMLAACSGSSAADNSGSSDAGAATGDTVNIGLNFELSGNVSDYGTKELKGAQLAIEQWNAKEDKPFEAKGVEVDDKGEPAESISAITKLIEQDKVAGVVGPATSASSIATYQIATDKQVPVISPSATQNGAELKSDGTPYDYAWRVCFEDNTQGKAMALFAYNTLGLKSVVIFNEVSDYGQGLAGAFKEEFESLGGTIVNQTPYDAQTQNFASQVTAIKDLDFDGIYIAGYYNESAQIVKAVHAEGIEVPILGADGFDSSDFVSQIGNDYANNVYFTTAYTLLDPSDSLKAFVDAYKEKFGEDPSMFSALAYDATNLLLDSLAASGETGAKLNEAIKTADFAGVTGSFTFDEETHTPNKAVLVVELKDGAQANVTEVETE